MTDEAFAQADRVVSLETHYPRSHPAPLETCGILADVNSVTGQATLYMTSQAPHAHRTLFAMVAGLPEQKIRIISPDIGGGFGNKVPIYPGYVVATAASLLLGQPVKWVESRTENLISTGFARDYYMKGDLALTDEGRILGLRVDMLSDQGAFYSDAQPTQFRAGLFHVVTGSYDFPAAHINCKGAFTNKAPGGVAYRCSFRITEASYLIERLVQTAAYELGIDPAEIRLRNFIQPEQFPYETATGFVYDSGDYPTALRTALDEVGYEDLLREQAEARAEGRLLGIGIAHFTEAVGAGPSHTYDIAGLKMIDSAELRVHPTGKAILKLGVKTQGQGHETTFAQIVAEELGIPANDIKVEHGDTDHTPYGLGTYGSRSTPGGRGGHCGGGSQAGRQGPQDRRAPAGGSRRGHRAGRRGVVGGGQPRPVGHHPRRGPGRLHQPARGHGVRPGGCDLLRPAQPHLSLRQLHRGGRGGPRHRGVASAAHGGAGRLWRADQPDDRGGADLWRPHRGVRHVVDAVDHLRRRRQLHRVQLHGLPSAHRVGDPPDSSCWPPRCPHPTTPSGPKAWASRPPWGRRPRS